MKKLLLLLLLIAANSFAQFTLEHSYPENFVTRVKLEYSGEKYYLFDAATGQVKLFNADHTPWKTISLGLAPNDTMGYIVEVSEAAFNTDDNIEICFAYYRSGFAGYTYYSEVISESGSVLLNVTDYFYASVSHISGLSDKLIVSDFSGNSKVYAMPGLALENTYTGGQAYRTKLESSGEKYFQLNAASAQAKIYNSDHTLWKTISAPKPAAATYTASTMYDISETTINTDALVELIYGYTDTGVTESFVVNETGSLLLSPGQGQLTLNKVEGLADKLFLTQTIPSLTTGVYDLPNPALQHTYTGNIFRTKLENSGEKYYQVDAGNVARVYNSDHTLWKSVPLALPTNFHTPNILMLTETAFDADPALEIAYSYYNDELADSVLYESSIIKENGTSLLTVPGAVSVYLSRIDGYDDKLIALMLSVSIATYDYGGAVYSINPTMAVRSFSKDAPSVYPNPASDIVHIRSAKAIDSATVYNTSGQAVLETRSADEVDVSMLAAGMYMLRLTDVDGTSTIIKILVTR